MKFLYLTILLTVLCGSNINLERIEGTIIIDKENGHELQEGCSGFNVRIADKVWSYNHPDFRKAVHELKPGWLRYFSGTMGDAFNCATGLYDKDYAWMFEKQAQYEKGYIFTDVKGPHRIIDLYELLGEVGGKLIVTINGFSETPQIAGELARFCKNNNIKVEVWQFCNEPYFYVPHRERYWWNDGYDYATKMKPYADSIRAVFPDAKLALNFTWDGIWGFMKEIHKYQEENGAYWNVFSKHSYAPHIGGKEPFEKAYKRGNSKIISATNSKAMNEIETYSWKGIPMIITEFGVWNRPLNGIYSSIYNVEYTLRQLEHQNTLFIGSHEVSNKCKPHKNLKHHIYDAYNQGKKINTNELITGTEMDDEGKALAIIHEATNNSNYTWDTQVVGGAMVDGLNNKKVNAVYARAFKGVNGFDYLVITNRSGQVHDFKVRFGDHVLKGNVERKYMFSPKAQNQNIDLHKDIVDVEKLEIPPYSVVLVKWKSKDQYPPSAPRIYKSRVSSKGIELTWWKRDFADGYKLFYKEDKKNLNKSVTIVGAEKNSITIEGLTKNSTYYFTVKAYNKSGDSQFSDTVKLGYTLPKQAVIFKTAPRDTSVTIMWKSVANATGYKVRISAKDFDKEYDAKNVFGYRISGLKYNIPYRISVVAYNGLGYGEVSDLETVECKKHLPIPPKNISAKELDNGNIYLKWIKQDTINPNVKYRLFRGTELHKFISFADNIIGDNYIDKNVDKGEKYYYTVKSYNEDGECNFYPNIATVIEKNRQIKISVTKISKLKNAYKIIVKFSNIRLDGDIYCGVAVSDISYLNTEEDIYRTDDISNGEFVIEIPFNKLRANGTYSVKGFVNTNGKSIYSLPPHKKIKIQ